MDKKQEPDSVERGNPSSAFNPTPSSAHTNDTDEERAASSPTASSANECTQIQFSPVEIGPNVLIDGRFKICPHPKDAAKPHRLGKDDNSDNEGGEGPVFLATDHRWSGKYVALKFFKRADARRIDCIAAWDKVTIPRIPRFLYYNDGQFFVGHDKSPIKCDFGYVAMDWIAGNVLSDRIKKLHASNTKKEFLKELRLIVRETRDLSIEIHKLHAGGVIHADIKDDNVLVEEGTQKFYLVDVSSLRFGKHVPDVKPKQMRGTESARSEAVSQGVDIDALADLESLGRLLFFVVAGIRPPDQKGDIEPNEISNRHARWISNPNDLVAIICKAIPIDSVQRYESLASFQIDLSDWLRGKPVSARPLNIFRHVGRFVVNNLIFVVIAVAFGLVTVAAAWMYLDNTRLYEANDGLAKSNAQITTDRDEAMGKVDLLAKSERELKTQLTEAATRIIHRTRVRDAVVRFLLNAVIEKNVPELRAAAETPNMATFFEGLLPKLESAPLDPVDADVFVCGYVAHTLIKLGRLDSAKKFASRAIDNLDVCDPNDDSIYEFVLDVQRSFFNAKIQGDTGDVEDALSMAESWRQKFSESPSEFKKRGIDPMLMLGDAYSALNRNDEAEQIYKKVYESRLSKSSEQNVSAYLALHRLAKATSRDPEQTQKAREMMNDACEGLRMSGLDNDHPHVLVARSTLLIWDIRSSPGANVDRCRELLADSERRFGPFHPETLDIRVYLISELLQSNDLANAVKEITPIETGLQQDTDVALASIASWSNIVGKARFLNHEFDVARNSFRNAMQASLKFPYSKKGPILVNAASLELVTESDQLEREFGRWPENLQPVMESHKLGEVSVRATLLCCEYSLKEADYPNASKLLDQANDRIKGESNLPKFLEFWLSSLKARLHLRTSKFSDAAFEIDSLPPLSEGNAPTDPISDYLHEQNEKVRTELRERR